MRGQLSKETRLTISVTRLKNGMKELREEISELKRSNREKDKTIALLREKLEDKEAQRKELASYLYKPGKKEGPGKPRGKKPGAPAYHRPLPKPEAVTEEHRYALRQCPACRKPVGAAVDTVVKYEEDIALKPPPTVKKYVISRHWCSSCETYVRSADIPPIRRIGINTLGYVLFARYRLRLPLNKIQESLQDLYDFKISEGEIVVLIKEAEILFGEDHEAIIALIREARVVYADESGWRMDGKNWWLWVFRAKDGTRYMIEDTRGKGVAEEALGDKEDRVLSSDGYAAYQNLKGDKQQCWVHLLRVAKLHSPKLYADLALLYKKLLIELGKPIRERDKKRFEEGLAGLIGKKYPEPGAKKVQARMVRHTPFLFTCLSYEEVLPENNTAERAIRTQVVMRKIFGGSRSLAGARAHAVNSSVLETMRQQNPDQGFCEVVQPLLEERWSEHAGK